MRKGDEIYIKIQGDHEIQAKQFELTVFYNHHVTIYTT